jgi:hypothetical protein
VTQFTFLLVQPSINYDLVLRGPQGSLDENRTIKCVHVVGLKSRISMSMLIERELRQARLEFNAVVILQ